VKEERVELDELRLVLDLRQLVGARVAEALERRLQQPPRGPVAPAGLVDRDAPRLVSHRVGEVGGELRVAPARLDDHEVRARLGADRQRAAQLADRLLRLELVADAGDRLGLADLLGRSRRAGPKTSPLGCDCDPIPHARNFATLSYTGTMATIKLSMQKFCWHQYLFAIFIIANTIIIFPVMLCFYSIE